MPSFAPTTTHGEFGENDTQVRIGEAILKSPEEVVGLLGVAPPDFMSVFLSADSGRESRDVSSESTLGIAGS
eukprot:CAMPEP_0184506080 /NCGR_PEP_ID=MMETSP0113_2-20130426/53314_1 /TAXON_ID=91329 /ORGANISM="Norrisiella sphaerica, Strain BC52" /LENGTH=71 /DNA_ID=CAMNT_0026895783 /DNA_START=308 /DNA_END=523 /DNA_ORIENTATION=-